MATPSQGPLHAPSASPFLAAIRDGAAATGAGFDYLVKTAQRESALDPNAKARTSSATGLFQFIEQTWLSMVRDEGARHGLGKYASAVTTGADGRANVTDPALKREILALRQDPRAAAAMAGELTLKNRDHLTGQLGRAPTEGELYVAHVLGAQGASDLIRAARQAPTSSAAALLPDAAAANRAIFFDKGGRARGAGEVFTALAAAQAGQASVTVAAADEPPAAAPIIRNDGPVMFGLFRTDGPRGPVSESVARLWNPPAPAAGADPALRYFPRSQGGGEVAPAEKPAEKVLSSSRGAEPQPAASQPVATASAAPAQVARKRQPGPLDLSRFMSWRTP